MLHRNVTDKRIALVNNQPVVLSRLRVCMLLPGRRIKHMELWRFFLFRNHLCFNTYLWLTQRGILCFAHAVARRLPGFWFWKAWADQSAVCCGPNPPISFGFRTCVGGPLQCFYSTYLPQSPWPQGVGAGLALRVPLLSVCLHAYVCACLKCVHNTHPVET